MPPSQLKRLKSSLREQGITGPQKSKKQKAAAAQGKNKSTNDRVQRNAALQHIRDSFNPFEIKAPSRPAKFEHASANRSGKKQSYKDVLHRPGVTKSAGEEMRRATLLPEMQRRNKVGGLVDRRIGEGDPGMTAEERAVQRFAQEKSRSRTANVFDLEGSDDDEPKISLTHGGRRLDDLPADDFGSVSGGDESEPDDGFLLRKRGPPAVEEEGGADGEEEQPQRKKSKKEVMEEVIAKSKFHKYERQKAKEDDDDLRDELDSGFQDMLSLLRGGPALPKPAPAADGPVATRSEPAINPDRQRLLDGIDRSTVDKEYEVRLRQLAQDARAKPSERTKTEEEKVAEEAERLRDLEERRMKRMRGEAVSEDEEGPAPDQADAELDDEENLPDEAAEFGFTNADNQPNEQKQQLVLEDEDEFALDEDLVASGSELDLSDDSASDEDSDDSDAEQDEAAVDDDEDEFVKDILGDEAGSSIKKADVGTTTTAPRAGLAYTYPCPSTHKEFLDVIKDSPVEQLPTIVQRIRALHHPSLSEGNKEAMSEFASVLVDHLAYMGMHKQPLAMAEQVMRHLHSLSRTYTEQIAGSFRQHLQLMHEHKDLNAGDLLLLTAIGTIYPTSDHFHQVVTPAMTLIARWLGLNSPDTTAKSAKGAFLVALCIKYQSLSKRYIPEALRFTYRALQSIHKSEPKTTKSAHHNNLIALAELWRNHSSFIELFTPMLPLLPHNPPTPQTRTLRILLNASRQSRRPLELHHHRPLAIRTSIPKFEEGYHPDKHYDPDRERAESTRLRKEFKRERKGAMRELRKDANFMARESLREKRARDEEYEKKYRRLVAEVQGEEAHAGKEYEKEKRERKRRRQG